MQGQGRTLAVNQQLVSSEGLLECRAHESVAGTGIVEDRQMDPEEGQVEEKRPCNQCSRPGKEVLPEVLLQVY